MAAQRTQIGTPADRRRALAALATRQHGVVHRRQLRARGFSDATVSRLVADGLLQRLHVGVYAVGRGNVPREGRLLAATLAAGPGSLISHRSAASWWGVRHSDRARIDVVSTRKRAENDRRIDLHRVRRLDPADADEHQACRTSSRGPLEPAERVRCGP